jgi:hypothetical protein
MAQLLFAADTSITIGDRMTTKFWHSAWLNGTRLKDTAPLLFASCHQKNRTVTQALHQNTCMLDLAPQNLTAQHLAMFIPL